MQTIVFANRKGGVGKSTSAIAVAAALAERGERVVLVDADTNAGVARALGLGEHHPLTAYDVLVGGTPIAAALVDARPNLFVLPADSRLALVNHELPALRDEPCIANHDLVDLNWIEQKYEIPGDRYGLFAMIRGDASDGLPGIKGIGEKGAASIAKQFTNLHEVMKAAINDDERLTANIRKKLLENAEYAKIAPKLVGCATDVSIPEMKIDLPNKPLDTQKIQDIKEEFGLGTSVDRIMNALGWI